MDPGKPGESLARRSSYHPGARQMYEPGVNFVHDTIKLALDFQADAASHVP